MVEIKKKNVGRKLFLLFVVATIIGYALGFVGGYFTFNKECSAFTIPIGNYIYRHSDTDIGNCTKNTAGAGYTCREVLKNVTCGCVQK